MRNRTEARWVKAHPELNKSKNGRWSEDDFCIWLEDGVAGMEMAEGPYRGKTISSLTVMHGDRPHKAKVSRDPNRMHITTTESCGILLETIEDVVQRKCFDRSHCAT